MFKQYLLTAASLLMVVISQALYAEPVVIVNPAYSGSDIAGSALKKIYMGKSKSFPSGGSVTPVNLVDQNPVRLAFQENMLGRSDKKMKAHWSMMIFSGKANPPKELDNDAAVVEFVAANADAIGYVDKASVSGSVKVIGIQ